MLNFCSARAIILRIHGAKGFDKGLRNWVYTIAIRPISKMENLESNLVYPVVRADG